MVYASEDIRLTQAVQRVFDAMGAQLQSHSIAVAVVRGQGEGDGH